MTFRRGAVLALLALLAVYVWPRDKPMLGPLYGRDNMAALWAAQVRARADGSPVVIHIVGDSKVLGVGTTDGYRIDQLLSSAANDYPVTITYEGFGGQNSYLWSHGEAADFVAQHADADLLIVNFNTNERVPGATGGAQSSAQTEANHRAAIATIRASRSPASLSILLLGGLPCNNNNPNYNQTTAVMATVNGILKVVASDLNTGFFDPLELFSRPHAEAGWMDNLNDGQHGGGNVHPGNPLNLVLVGELGKVLFPLPYSAPIDGVGTVSPGLANGWTKWAAGYEPKAVYDSGQVTLGGLARPGSKRAAGTVLFNLPAGYRPPVNRFFTVPSTNAGSTMQVQILASGAVRIGGAFRGDYISLDGITYRTT